jgi:uncharacterized OB-fold protein
MELRDVPPPELEHPLFRPYWEGMSQGRLMLPRCRRCDRMNWPPRPICLRCRGTELRWEEQRPEGTLFTWTVVGRATAPGYSDVPYIVGVVSLDAVPVRLMGQVVGVDPDDVCMGMPLTARFTKVVSSPEFTLIQFAPSCPSPDVAP